MNKSTLSLFAVVCSSIFGCAAPDQDSQPESASVDSASFDLTVEECGTQRDNCFRKNPLFGLFTCPAQYTQCVATAQDGVPAQVAAAAAATAECVADAAECVRKTPAKAASCAATRAQCVADVVGVKLPPIVEGTAGCVDATVACVDDATRPSNLVECAEDLTGCAVEEAVSATEDVIDATVGPVLEGANKCRLSFESCVDAATKPAELAECTADNAACVAEIFDVTLPDVPLDQVGECAEAATECAFDARRVSDVAKCAENLSSCAGDVIEDTTNVPAPLTCAQKWSACVAKDPLFGFISCPIQLGNCQD